MTSFLEPANGAGPWLHRLEQRCPAFTRPVAFLAVLGMLTVSSITMADVLLRWITGSGVVGLNEIVQLVFAVTVTACLPYGAAMRINLRLDILDTWIVGRLAAWTDAVGMILSLLFLSLLTWRVGIYAQEMDASGQLTLILLWPIAPSLYGIAVMLAVTVLVQCVVAANSLMRAVSYGAAEPGQESSSKAWLFVCLVYGLTALLLLYGLIDFSGLSSTVASNPGLSLAAACLLLWLLLMALAPLAATMGLLGVFCMAFFVGVSPAFSASGSEVAGFLTNSQVSVLPLFLMMGSFAAVSGIAEDVYALAQATFGRLRGGLALATIGGCAGFGAITGSTLATTAMVGRVALPEMQSRGYSPALATGCIAAGGTLGNLVPPAAALVLFALLTEASIGRLFVAAAVPALLIISAYILATALYVCLAPGSAPGRAKPKENEFRRAARRCLPAAGLFCVVLGGLYAGIFTDTEAAAVGAFGTFMIALLRGKLRRASFLRAMGDTSETTALIYPLIFSAFIFALFTDLTEVTRTMTALVATLEWPPLAIVGLLLASFIVFGTFMDAYTVMIVTVPIVTGLITGMGYDILWWGVLNLFVIEIGGISPPFGLTMFVLKDMAKVPIGVVFLGVTPFCVAGVVALAILTIFPEIALWLPSTMN